MVAAPHAPSERHCHAESLSDFSCSGLVSSLLRRADTTLSERSVVRYLERHQGNPVVLYRDYEKLSSMVFYLGHPVPVLESESNELYYAHQHHASDPSFLDAARFRALAEHHRVWLVMTPDHVQEVLSQFHEEPASVVHRFPRAVILSMGPGLAGATDIHRAVVAAAPKKRGLYPRDPATPRLR